MIVGMGMILCCCFPLVGEISTVAGSGEAKLETFDGPATEMNIGQTFGVEIDPDGKLYVTEVQNHRVIQVELASGHAKTVAGNGVKGYSGDGGPATKASLNEPYEVRFDNAGNMFFVEMQNHLIRRVDAKTGIISTVAGTGEQGLGGDGGPATKAKFNRPHSIALQQNDGVATAIYVADIGNHRIRRIDLSNGTIETIAGNGDKDLPVEGQTAKGNSLVGPRALFLQDDTLWIALREGHSVWKLDLSSGKLHHIAGTGKRGFSGDGGPALEATFDGPKGIAVGPDGNLFVVDTENQAIRKIEMKTGTITTIAGYGPDGKGFSGDGADARKAKLGRPHGICVDKTGNVYIGDTLNHRVRKIAAGE